MLFGRFVNFFDSNKWSLVLFVGVVTTPAKNMAASVFFLVARNAAKLGGIPIYLSNWVRKKNPPLAVFGVGKFVSSSNSQCPELGNKSFPTFLREIQGW